MYGSIDDHVIVIESGPIKKQKCQDGTFFAIINTIFIIILFHLNVKYHQTSDIDNIHVDKYRILYMTISDVLGHMAYILPYTIAYFQI